jgi:hypothetical protein
MPRKELVQKYFTKIGNRNWLFYGLVGDKKKFLFQMTDVAIKRHVLIRKGKNAYLPEDQEYFLYKTGKIAQRHVWGKYKLVIAKKTAFKCKVCDEIM